MWCDYVCQMCHNNSRDNKLCHLRDCIPLSTQTRPKKLKSQRAKPNQGGKPKYKTHDNSTPKKNQIIQTTIMENEQVRIFTQQLRHLNKHFPLGKRKLADNFGFTIHLATYLKNSFHSNTIIRRIIGIWSSQYDINPWEWKQNDPSTFVQCMHNRCIPVLSLIYELLNHAHRNLFSDEIQWLLTTLAGSVSITLPTDPAPLDYPLDDLRHPRYEPLVNAIRQFCTTQSNAELIIACLIDHFNLPTRYRIFESHYKVTDMLISPYLLQHLPVSDLLVVANKHPEFGFFKHVISQQLSSIGPIIDTAMVINTTIAPTTDTVSPPVLLSTHSNATASSPQSTQQRTSLILKEQKGLAAPLLDTSPPTVAQASAPLDTTNPSIKSSNTIEDRTKCVVCFEGEREMCFLPCGHVCCCTKCAQDVMHVMAKKCPLCRTECKQTIRIYY